MNNSLLQVVLFLQLAAIARARTVESFPHPQINASECGSSSAFICDEANALSANERLELGNITVKTIDEVRCTACPCAKSLSGFYIAVATISNFSYKSANVDTQPDEEKAFANALLQRWKPSPCGNDILLLIFTKKSKLVITYGNVSAVNVPTQCAKEVEASADALMQQKKFFKALEAAVWEVRTVYRNSESSSWPSCFGKSSPSNLSATAIVLIVLSIVVAFAFGAFLVWHIYGQRKLRYLNYNPNRRGVRFNSYSGSAEYGVGEGGIVMQNSRSNGAPSTVTGEYAMWQGSVCEGSYDNPGFAEAPDTQSA